VRHVIATGQSGSAAQLRHYYNSVHPIDSAVDGFVLHGAGQRLRTDLRTPVFKIMAETDVIRVQAAIRQPDSDYLRTWEVAGSSHLDVDIVRAHLRLKERDRPDLNQEAPPNCVNLQPSRLPARLVQHAVYDWMRQWVAGTARPPRAPPIEMSSIVPPTNGPDGFSVVRRDEHGNALGGIRLAEFAVPIATNSGVNDLAGTCFGYGLYTPFDSVTVVRLYPTRARYIEAINRTADENLRAGFVTPEGADQMKRDAAALRWPPI
jgi:hypothetical protein